MTLNLQGGTGGPNNRKYACLGGGISGAWRGFIFAGPWGTIPGALLGCSSAMVGVVIHSELKDAIRNSTQEDDGTTDDKTDDKTEDKKAEEKKPQSPPPLAGIGEWPMNYSRQSSIPV